MRNLSGIKYTSSGVPVLSRTDLERIADNQHRLYREHFSDTAETVNVERYLTDCLHVNFTRHYLSNSGYLRGLVAFTAAEIPVYVPERNRAEYVKVPADTVIIDEMQFAEEKKAIRRFTEAHEAGHILLHRPYFTGLEYRGKIVAEGNQNRQDGPGGTSGKKFGDRDWIEWQADVFASCFLLPGDEVRKIADTYADIPDRERRAALQIVVVSSVLEVSEEAARIRLEGMGILPKGFRPDMEEIRFVRNFRTGFRRSRFV